MQVLHGVLNTGDSNVVSSVTWSVDVCLLTLIVKPIPSELYTMYYTMQHLSIQVDNLLSLQITCLLTLMAIRYKHQLLYWTNLQSQCHITNTSITILTCTGEMLKCIMIDKRCFMSPVLRMCRSSWAHVVSGVPWLNLNYDHYHDFKSPDYQMSSRICPWWPFIITTVSDVVYLTLRRWDNL